MNLAYGNAPVGSFTDPYETDDDLEFSYFEVLGMNPSPPQLIQWVLIRYVLRNTDIANGVLFDADAGIDIRYTDPLGANLVFGSNYQGSFLGPDKKIINYGVFQPFQQQVAVTDWDFWPHYIIAGNPPLESPQFDVWTVNILDHIYFDDFEGQWPGDWTVEDFSQAATSYLWYQVVWPGPGGAANNLCPWCSGIDDDDNVKVPSVGPPWALYEIDQDTDFYIVRDWRYIGLRIYWDLWLQLANQNNNDKLLLRTSDGTNPIVILTFTWAANTQNVGLRGPAANAWQQMWVDVPHSAFEAGANTRIDWQFVSDNQNFETGAFIDSFWVDTTGR